MPRGGVHATCLSDLTVCLQGWQVSAGPRSIAEAVQADGEFRAGGTDLQDRYRSGLSRAPAVDLRGLPDLDRIEWNDNNSVRLGALVSVATLAADARLERSYPALSAAARELATPQIRSVATLGGNLLQRNRCWYFRQPAVDCFRKGGETCPARDGNHLYHVCFDLGPCVAPHPSTLGMTLLAYDAEVHVHDGSRRPLTTLYGDGSDPRREHQLGRGELLTAVQLPPPVAGEQAAYTRTTSRSRAEWPLVEAVVRLVVDTAVRYARVAVGAVAPVPLRLPHVEEALVGQPADRTTFERAAALAADRANPLPQTRYKVDLVRATVLHCLELAAQSS